MLRFRDDLAGLQVLQPRGLAPGQLHLPPREIDGVPVLDELFVEFLDRQPCLLKFPFEPVDVEFVVPGIDLEEQRAGLDELSFIARLGLRQHAAADFGGQGYLPQRHDHAVGLDRQPIRLGRGLDGPHGRRSGHIA